jgi:hypothetical protein
MKRCFWFVVGLLLIVSLFSCNLSSIQEFEVGEGFVDSGSGVVLIDTMNVATSTVQFDSIITNNSTSLLIGGYKNSYTGTVTASPYFQLNSGTFTIDDDDLIYDSLVVKLNYDGYYIGDTTKLMTMNVRRVAEEIALDDNGYLYNTSSFLLDGESLGEATFYPRPLSSTSFYIHLSDQLGKVLFNNIIAKNDTMTTSSYFREYFRGMAFVSNENQNQAAVGFAHDSVSVRVYYHELVKTVESKEKTYFTFPVSTTDIWYNQIRHNSSGSLLSSIAANKNELISSFTSDQTMVQAGNGVYTKIKIPGISFLKGYGKNVAFIASKIQITPLENSYSDSNPLPDSLSVYIADRKNRITSQLSTSLGYTYANKVVPSEYGKLPYYEVDVSSFFTSGIAASLNDNCLLIGCVASKVGKTINPIVFSGNSLGKTIVQMHVYCYIDKSK